MFSSKFRIYSVGVVAENKPLSSREVQIVPTEVLPFLDGELKSNPEPFNVSGVDADDQSYEVSVNTDNAIEATWLQWNTNRQTPPDVRRGERVLLWQFADTDVFYWTSLGMDQHLRKLETVRHVISATRDEADTTLRPDNTYSVELSTHTKSITLKTAMADGEPHEYTIQVNAKDGIVVITDDIDNHIQMESRENRITSKNADGTHVTLDKKEIRAFAKDLCEIHVDGPCNVIAPTINLGEEDLLQPSTRGNDLANALATLIQQINDSKVIGNLGSPTSPIKAVKPVNVPDLMKGGKSYSDVNKNQ